MNRFLCGVSCVISVVFAVGCGCLSASKTLDSFGPGGQTIEEHYPLSEVETLMKVTSGGMAIITPEGKLLTLQGDLGEGEKWRKLYANNSDTLWGRRPQNIFRILFAIDPLPSADGFYMEVSALANDFEPPSPQPYDGGFDIIAQWWSPGNINPAFLCREQYGGFCGNVGYHAKVHTNGALEISRERPKDDNEPRDRYESLRRTVGGYSIVHPQGRQVRFRLEVSQKGPGSVFLEACVDNNQDGVWDERLEFLDQTRPIHGYFVPIIRSDWISAEFSEPRIGVLSPGQRSCANK